MFVTTLALVLAMSTPQVADLLPDSTTFLESGSYPFRTGTAVVLDTARNLAFVGAGSGVFIVDVSDPNQPVILSDRMRCGTAVKDMLLDGTRLYLALFSVATRPDLPRDVEIWDVSVPSQPLRMGGIDLYFGAQCIYARGDTLLIGSLRSLFTYDVSDLDHPVRLDSVGPWCMAEQICVRDTLAFVSSTSSGVHVYDVRSLAHPALLAVWGASCSYPGLDVLGDRLYLAGSWGPLGEESGLRVYDISDPLRGQLLGVFDAAMSGAYRVALKDTVAAVTYAFRPSAATSALKVVSVSNPSSPAQLAAYGGLCTGIVLSDTVAYVAFRDRFEILNLADPSQPTRTGSVPLGLAGSQIVTQGGMAYSVGGSFTILDARSSLDIELTGALDMGNRAWALAKDDSVALVAVLDDTGGGGVEVVATGDAHHPRVLASLPGITQVRSLLTNNSLAYVASESGLAVFDLTDPGNPVRVGGLSRSIAGPRAILRDTFLFACDNGHLVVLSVADPGAVYQVVDTAIAVYDFLLCDIFLYVLPQSIGGRKEIWDIGSLPDIMLTGQYVAPMNQVGCAALTDTFMVLASGFDLLAAFSVSEPASPVLLGTVLMKDAVEGLDLAGDTLYTSLVSRYRLVRSPSGIELEPIGGVEARPLRVWPSVVKSVLNLAGRDEAVLFDASGRRVLRLRLGANDVRGLAPGVYFVCEQVQAQGHASVRKVVVTR